MLYLRWHKLQIPLSWWCSARLLDKKYPCYFRVRSIIVKLFFFCLNPYLTLTWSSLSQHFIIFVVLFKCVFCFFLPFFNILWNIYRKYFMMYLLRVYMVSWSLHINRQHYIGRWLARAAVTQTGFQGHGLGLSLPEHKHNTVIGWVVKEEAVRWVEMDRDGHRAKY